MLIHTTNALTIHFGTNNEGFAPKSFYAIPTQQELFKQTAFNNLTIPHIITLEQTHSTLGYVFNKEQSMSYRPYSLEGDYLITDQAQVGLGVATADCLPIILYDPKKNVIGIAHAGWKGTANNIATIMLTHMHTVYNNNLADIRVFFGPAARSCCYKVQPDFLNNFILSTHSAAVVTRDNTIYFDTSTYNYELLINAGIPAQNINRDYNTCTICNPTFCSHRRSGIMALRQMTVVSLN